MRSIIILLFVLILVVLSSCLPPPDSFDDDSTEPECGNNIIELGEECDNGISNGLVCTPSTGGSCTYCSADCKLITTFDSIALQDFHIIELSRHATILDGPFNIVHDRRASNNLSVNAPWKYQTFGGTYNSIEPLKFSFTGDQNDVSVWIRYYKEISDSKGWRLTLSNGASGTVNSDKLNEYVWVEAYRGMLSGTVNIGVAPLGPRSKIDTAIITTTRDPSGFDALLNLTKPRQVPQAKYYVSMSGSDSNSGSITSPFKTIQKAIDVVQPGETILVRAGTYAGFKTNRIKGRNDAWITIQAYPGERVILDGYITNHDVAVIEVRYQSTYLIIDGFEIINTDPMLEEIRKLDVTKSNDLDAYLVVKDTLRPLAAFRLWHTSTAEASHNLIFSNLEIHQMFGLGFSGHTNSTLFLNNHIYDIGYPRSGYAWYSGGGQNVYRGNIVHDAVRGIQARTTGELHTINTLYEQNLFYRNGRFWWYHGSSGNLKRGAHAIVIQTSGGGTPLNNTLRNNIFIYNGNGLEDRTYTSLIAHNSFINNGNVSSTSFSLRLRGSDAKVTNNLFYDNRRSIEDSGSNSVFTSNIDTNLPVYMNPYGLDFTVVQGAPIINSGVNMPRINNDFYSTTRPQGSGWDVGAIER